MARKITAGHRAGNVSMDQICNATTAAHADAMSIVELLIEHNGTVDITQDDIARKLNMMKHLQGGISTVDKSRFNRAKNHIQDRDDIDGKPCCGYRIHYRRSGKQSTLSLSDPSGDLGSHIEAAIGSLLGWMSRERQHQTESQRQSRTWESLADDVLANGDKAGYRLLQMAIIDLDRDGTVLPATMAQLQVWASRMTVS